MRLRSKVGFVFALGLASYCAAAQEVTTYAYDALGRLTASSSSTSSRRSNTAIKLDQAGNRVEVNVSVTPTASIPTIRHRSFEAPSVGAGFEYRPNQFNDLYFVGKAGLAGNGSAWAFPPAPNGSQVGFVQDSDGSISTNATGLTVGATYRIRFKASKRQYFPANTVWVTFQGKAFGAYTPTSVSFQQFETGTFVATAEAGVLGFAGQSTGDTGTGIDDLEIVPVI